MSAKVRSDQLKKSEHSSFQFSTLSKIIEALGISLVDLLTERSKEFAEEKKAEAKAIIRSIEFLSEYLQAGIIILNNFSGILRRRYAGKSVKVLIEQEDLKVTLVIIPPDGEKERIEELLSDYGRVVSGKMALADFTLIRLC